MNVLTRLTLCAALGVLAAISLGGCTGSISANPVQDIAGKFGPAKLVIQDATDNADNLAQAVAVGALDPSDPAPACAAKLNALVGIGQVPAASFSPKVSGVISASGVLYIRTQQLKRLSGGGLTLPVECLTVLGQMQVDALRGAVQGLPGGGLLPGLR